MRNFEIKMFLKLNKATFYFIDVHVFCQYQLTDPTPPTLFLVDPSTVFSQPP